MIDPEPDIAAHGLSPGDFAVLRRMAGTIIGASAQYGVPGADDIQIAAMLLKLAGGQHGDVIRAGVREFAASCARSGGADGITDADHQRLLREFATQRPEFSWRLLLFIAQAYYQDERVIRSLGMQPRAPFPLGNKLEPSDWTLLDPVRSRPFSLDGTHK